MTTKTRDFALDAAVEDAYLFANAMLKERKRHLCVQSI